jgi:hypothetical protein
MLKVMYDVIFFDIKFLKINYFMIESPSEFANKKEINKIKKKGSLEKEIIVTELERRKFKKDFDKFVEERQKNWPQKVYIAIGLWIVPVILGQFLSSIGIISLFTLFIPAVASFFHMALIEYYRGNVNWTNYIWGALVAVWIGGIGLFILWFFASGDVERLKNYIEERKNKNE